MSTSPVEELEEDGILLVYIYVYIYIYLSVYLYIYIYMHGYVGPQRSPHTVAWHVQHIKMMAMFLNGFHCACLIDSRLLVSVVRSCYKSSVIMGLLRVVAWALFFLLCILSLC